LVLAISCSVWAGAQIRTETKTVYYRADLKIVVDGRQTTLDVEPFIVDPGWIMVPAEFISKELGAAVAWDDASSTFTITTKGTAASTATATNGTVTLSNTASGIGKVATVTLSGYTNATQYRLLKADGTALTSKVNVGSTVVVMFLNPGDTCKVEVYSADGLIDTKTVTAR
jgi:hypothetical protein